MTLTGLRSAVAADASADVIRQAAAGGADHIDLVAPEGHRAFALDLIADSLPDDRPVVAVVATGREADALEEAVADLVGPDDIAVLPSWETLPHERLSPSAETVGRRATTLHRLAHGPMPRILVTTVRALVQPLIAGLGDLAPVRVSAGETLDLTSLLERLIALGYERTELVERRGQVAARGGIVDVFPAAGSEHPVRLEWWGDVVEDIRTFAVADQRSLESLTELTMVPARELLITDAVRQRAAALVESYPAVGDLLSQIADGGYVAGMEALAPILADGLESLVALLPRGSVLVMCDPERIRARAEELVRTSQEFLDASWHAAAAGATTPLDLSISAYRPLEDLEEEAASRGVRRWTIGPFAGEDAITLAATPVDGYRGDLAAAAADMVRWTGAGDAVVVVAAGHGGAERLAAALREHDLQVDLLPDLDTSPTAGRVSVTTARRSTGIALPGVRLLTEADLLGQRATTREIARMPSRRRRTIDPLQLVAGDHVVHETHGVGRYVEMTQRTVGDATREYLVLEYAAARRGQPPDRLYVPTDQLDQVTRYTGGEAPSLHRLGGSDWQRSKGRARRAVKEIAAELVRLYASRQAAAGRAFGPDTPWQHELEDAFPYVETPDQLASIDEVKRDMERAVPMDRVICGDVGYGKTEIAVRAAFKAVQDGTQVAVLVPTTLLVQQHLATFADRYSPFPVRVAALSRFQSEAEAREVVQGLADGSIDVVIGTHRLLTPDVRFKDLGLVIVDEEQRFGVEHKEHLKALRTSVDILSMSATPIPRTLEMSLTGIREMSTIQTPPEERHPVLTFVGPYDDRQVAAAIRRELLRDGQAFFVHNRVSSIDRVAARLRALVPEARIAAAHGQMNESDLERVVVDFWEGRIDVLVSTTIIENGIDIANANTLIVDRADALGLAQLHQLRGRVGRGRERGYAYFLYPPESPLTETAHERLATIAQNADLGAGMQIAMKDLEIRGAGHLLGEEQSGHIAEVGFDLYVRLVGEALAEYRGDAAHEPLEVRVELPVNAHLPHDYIPEERLRLEAYRRLAAAGTDADVAAVAEELADRYGPVPAPVAELLEVARLRVRARAAGLEEIVAQGTRVRFHPVELPESRAMRLTRLHPGSVIKPAIRTILVPKPSGDAAGTDLVAWAAGIVDLVDPGTSRESGT